MNKKSFHMALLIRLIFVYEIDLKYKIPFKIKDLDDIFNNTCYNNHIPETIGIIPAIKKNLHARG